MEVTTIPTIFNTAAAEKTLQCCLGCSLRSACTRHSSTTNHNNNHNHHSTQPQHHHHHQQQQHNTSSSTLQVPTIVSSRNRRLSSTRQSFNSTVVNAILPSLPFTKHEPISDPDWREGQVVPRSWGFCFAAVVALFVWSVTLLSWITIIGHYFSYGSLLALPTGPGRLAKRVWYFYSLVEVPFSIYYRYLLWKGAKRLVVGELDGNHLSKLLTKCLLVGLSNEERESVLHEREENGQQDEDDILDDLPTHGMAALQRRRVGDVEAKILRDRLRRWFHYAELDDIYMENVREWLSWAFASQSLEAVLHDKETKARIDEGVEMIMYRLNWTNIKPGYNPKVKAMRLTIDPMRVFHRPLGYYIVCNSITHGTILWLRLFHGFHYEYSGRCSYLVKPPTNTTPPSQTKEFSSSSSENKLPILFLHGLGIGLGQYIAFLTRLVHHTQGVVILIQPNISADITHPNFLNPPNKTEQADATTTLLKKLNMPKVMTISHSNGTMVLGWLLRKDPHLCAHNILVDPVSFRLWEGSVCYAFVYRRWTTLLHVLLGYFVARELGTARTIARDFQWSDMCLWVDEFESIDPEKFHVVFGEDDLLVDVNSCVGYLKGEGVKDEAITVVPKYQHGIALFLEGKGLRLVCRLAGIL